MVRHQWLPVGVTSIVLSGLFLLTAVACGAAATSAPSPTATTAPPVAAPAATTAAAPVALAPTEQGVTRQPLGGGAGSVKAAMKIEAGKTNIVGVKATLAPGGFLGWHYHDGPTMWTVLSGAIIVSHADGVTEEFPAGSAFFEQPGKGDIHRMDNKGAVDAAYLVTVLMPAGLPAMVYVPGPAAPVAAAPTPKPAIQTKTLFERRVEQLPQEPLCWDVRTGSLAPGAKSPATGAHTHGSVVSYVTAGAERVTYDGGASFTVNAGEGILFEENKGHVHESIGTVPRTNIGFELTCQRQPNSLATSGPLPGIRSGAVPYQVQLRERTWPSGAQTPVHVLSGPTTTYVLEGTIGRSTASGTASSGQGELYVSPVGEIAQNTCVSSTPCRTIDIDTWPSGETRSVPQPPDTRLPAPAVAPAVPGAATPTEQGVVTREVLGSGSGNVKEAMTIEAGKTNVVGVKATLAPGGFLGWHYHDGPTLWTVLSGTITISHAGGITEEFPAGTAFFERPGKGEVHRMDNKGTVDATYLVTVLMAPQVPAMVYVPGPAAR